MRRNHSVRESNYAKVENTLVVGMRQMKENKVPISGELIRQKGRNFAEKLGVKDFLISDRYIQGLKRRNQIEFINERGESDSVSVGVINKWKEQLPKIIEGYDQNDLFNLDETALFLEINAQ